MLPFRVCTKTSNIAVRHILQFASKTSPFPGATFTSTCLRSAKVSPGRLSTTNAKTRASGLPRRKPDLTSDQLRAAHYADRMYAAGKTALYRAPSQSGFLVGSWVLGAGCIASTAVMLGLKMYELPPDSGLPWFVPVAYRMTMAFMTGLGFWVLWRSTRLVTAIDLVEHAGEGKMRVSVRRLVPVPFVRPRHIMTAPYNLELPRTAIAPGTVPTFAQMPREDKSLRFGTWAAAKISSSLYNVFAQQRQIFTHEGFAEASIKGQGYFRLDIAGVTIKAAASYIASGIDTLRFITHAKGIDEQRLHMADMSQGFWGLHPQLQPTVPTTADEVVKSEDATHPRSTTAIFRGSIQMIKLESGDPAAEWMVHKHLLIAASGFARAAVMHDLKEKSTHTINIPDTEPEALEVFARYLYTEKIDVTTLDLDQLLATYILADYLDSPTFADLVFEQIYSRTKSPLFSYSVGQISYVLSHTLPGQPLHTLFLDQLGRGILLRKYNYHLLEERAELEPVVGDLMDAVVRVVNEVQVILDPSTCPSSKEYPKHTSRHDAEVKGITKLAVVDPQNSRSVPYDPQTTARELDIGRGAVELVMLRASATRDAAIKALDNNMYNTTRATEELIDDL